jgi:hypothetical protein
MHQTAPSLDDRRILAIRAGGCGIGILENSKSFRRRRPDYLMADVHHRGEAWCGGMESAEPVQDEEKEKRGGG